MEERTGGKDRQEGRIGSRVAHAGSKAGSWKGQLEGRTGIRTGSRSDLGSWRVHENVSITMHTFGMLFDGCYASILY